MNLFVGYPLIALASMATVLYPPVGLAIWTLVGVRTRAWRRDSAWPVIALAFAVLACTAPILRADLGVALRLLGEALLVVLAGLVMKGERRQVAIGLCAALVVIAAAAGLDHLARPHTWGDARRGVTPRQAIAWLMSRPEHLSVSSAPVYRTWGLSRPGREVMLRADLRLDAGRPGWAWSTSTQQAQMSPRSTLGAVWTHFSPTGPNPFIYRSFDTGSPLSGHTFRASVDLRSGRDSACGSIYLAEQGAEHRAERRVCPGRTWATYTLSWTAPPSAHRHTVDIIVNGFHGTSLELRKPVIDEQTDGGWTALAPLAPEGVQLTLSWGRGAPWSPQAGHTRALQVVPSTTWHPYTLRIREADLDGASQVWARLTPEQGLAVSVRRTALISLGPGGGRPTPLPLDRPGRDALWFGAFNLAAHTTVVAALALLAVTESFLLGAGGALLAILAIAATGSRSAFGVALIGFPWLLWFLVARRHRRAYLVVVGVAAVTLAEIARSGLLGRLRLWLPGGASDPVSRPAIWDVALRAFLTHPLRGIGGGAGRFAAYWQTHAVTGSHTTVAHAHNLWLQFAASYGLPGLAAAIVLAGGMALLAWRRGRWRGLALVVPILTLQLFDYTLFFSAVLFTAILGVNSIQPRSDGAAPDPDRISSPASRDRARRQGH